MRSPMSALGRVLRLWRAQAGWLVLGVLVSLASLATGVALMAVSGGAVGAIVTGGALVGATLLLHLLGPARVVLRYLERLLTHDALFRALAGLRVWFFRGLAARSAGGLGFRHAGDVLSRLAGDVEALDGVYLRTLVPLAGAVLLLPVLAVAVGRADIRLAVVVVLLFAVSAFVLPLRAARAAAAAGAGLAAAAAGLRIACLDALTGLREVRAFGAEGRMLAAMQAREAALLAAQHALARRGAWAGAAAMLCAQAGLLAVLVAAGLHPAGAAAVLLLAVAAFEAVSLLPRAGVAVGAAAVAAQRVIEAAEGPIPVPDPAAPAPAPRGHGLRFEALRFAWSPDSPVVFDGLTLEVPERGRVALLGPSGTGKSTLTALALKAATPQQGRVLLGGVDIATLPAAVVRARVGWLAQATHLFDDTVRANLLLARPDADDAALWDALRAAQIEEVVRSLPGGLDAVVGEGGASLSGGQGRRLALARALLSPAPLLILDEPCAGFDAETERAFLATLNDVLGERAMLLIVHRLTGVERLDRIWRLSAGRAVAAAG
jgi:ATP-binding cassette subfamily C protein CydC